MTELDYSAHSVSECNAHLQLTPAYRRAVFSVPVVRELCAGYLKQKCDQLGVRLAALDFGPDHVHLFIENWRRYAPAELARLLKGYTSYMMRRGHASLFQRFLWGSKFWSGGYFFRTVGVVTAGTVKKYILQSQGKHWKTGHKSQATLLGYAV